jgi:hypothetical protein
MDRNDAIGTARAALKPAVVAGVFSGHPTRLKRFLLKFSMTSLAHDGRTWDETAFRYDDERGGPVVTKANAGDAEADAVLREIASAQLQEGLPRNLAAYVRNVLAGRNLLDSRGRPRNFDRDICIHYVVEKIRGLGFEATRNEASKTDSACAIVAAALTELDVRMSEKNVERIWLGVQRSIPAMRNRDGRTELPPTS